MMRQLACLICVVLLLVGLSAHADAPRVISFQGKLTDPAGVPEPGVFEMTFRLWDAATGGTVLVEDVQHSVEVDDEGLYNVHMDIPVTITFEHPVWLGVEVESDGEMSPRYRLACSPYSFWTYWAEDAGMLEGNTVADLDMRFVNENQVNSITSMMIVDGSIVDEDVSPAAEIDPAKIKGKAWTSENDGSDSGLDADYLDGKDSGEFIGVDQDYGRSGVSSDLYEGSTKLTDKYVNEGQANAITSGMIKDGEVKSGDLADGSVTEIKLVPDAVTTTKIKDGEVGTPDLGDLSVTSVKLQDGSVATAKMADDAVTSYKIKDGEVKTSDLKDLSVSSAKLLNGSVITSKIADGTIVNADISGSANIDPAKIEGTAWTSLNDGSGSGLNADLLDGKHAHEIAGGGNWNVTDSVLYTDNYLGIARGSADNVLYGDSAHTHVNLGVACTTGIFGGTSRYCTVSGGRGNKASVSLATVGGGEGNEATYSYAMVGGGYLNKASHLSTTVGGGSRNKATDRFATVCGGNSNAASGRYAAVGGGISNTVSDSAGTVGGGWENKAEASYATVGGGVQNEAIGIYATVSGGELNKASDQHATIGGGKNNKASYKYATVAGGIANEATDLSAAVGGGVENRASNWRATVGGGCMNFAGGQHATIGGGYSNHASGSYATVGGGYNNEASGPYSFSANRLSNALHSNSAAFNGQTTTASGQTRVGILSKASGLFTIDHPLHPDSKILNHYFVESPEMVLIYRGIAHIGSNGRAEVHLPDYFDALNRSPMVQLTGVGTSDVYVAEKVSGNRFVIGGKPDTEVYWTVTGDRKDPSAEITRIIMPVEQLKGGDIAGHSLDDDFLATTKPQLDDMGKGSTFSFRTQSGREEYEEMLRPPDIEDLKRGIED